jgi:hypothetical protein
MLFNLALEYSIRRFQENKRGLEVNGTHQLLVYAHDVSLLGENVHIIKKNIEVLLDDSREVGLEVNAERTKYMFMSRHQTTGQKHYIKVALKMWQSSNIWEQIKIGFIRKLSKAKKKNKAVPLHTMETHGGRGGIAFFTSALDGSEWSASRPGHALPPGKEPPVPVG